MIYIVKSDTNSLINKINEKIINSNSIDESNVYVFDYEEKDEIEESFLEYLSTDISNEKKVVILKNANFINEVKPNKNIELKILNLIDVSNENTLILTVSKLNKTGKIIKKIRDSVNVIEKDSPKNSELNKFIYSFYENRGIVISNESIESIINRVGNNFDILTNELDKLALLEVGNEVNIESIEKSTLDFSRERLFKISEYVITLNEYKVKELMNQFRAEGEGIYLIVDFIIKDFSKYLTYNILKSKNNYVNPNTVQKSTGWNIWALKNYDKWSNIWPDIDTMFNFYKDILVKNIYFNIALNNIENPLDSLEKILVSNILKIKSLN